jgi:hypothetical protein
MRHRYPGLLLSSLRQGCQDKPERGILQLKKSALFMQGASKPAMRRDG